MLRTATPEAIACLRCAALGTDRDLDAALARLGILPPADLAPIRACLADPATVIVAGINRDGHRRLEVRDDSGARAWIDHDGEIIRTRRPLATT